MKHDLHNQIYKCRLCGKTFCPVTTDKFWEKLGRFFGHVIAGTLVVCAWLLIVVFTLKLIWFILFRILL